MIYKALGIMSGSSLDGLDLALVSFHESGGKWQYEILNATTIAFSDEWVLKLKNATHLNAKDYVLLHTDFGKYIGQAVIQFIKDHQLEFKIGIIGSHGHTTFHFPEQNNSCQIGDGASIAAITGLPVVTDLRNMDVALGGQGAPIIPIGEKLLWSEYDFLLNIGGIANISIKKENSYLAYDICSANAILNHLANQVGKAYDEDGKIAASGTIHQALLQELNSLDFYQKNYPKSLANQFGWEMVLPIIQQYHLSPQDALHTYTVHIAEQIKNNIELHIDNKNTSQFLITGGGALNTFLIDQIKDQLSHLNIEVVVPDVQTIQFKEATVMALMAVLRWREENNVLSSVTGASRDSVGGAMWMGQES
ncbi:MAG: anhydro-N-acetylmuramic acid kinase [Chitinophagaceae bacterium]|nr:MAG: anhydro-N-acetylmuramic acid kinase [Chitinophagaceae bacterium]